MAYSFAICACLVTLLLLGAWERLARDRARRALPIRIHVNGTRGKSTVVRLIWGALCEAGVPTVAKTTGTAPRLLLPDGTESPVRRLAPATIREQLWLLRRARRAGARAVVAECMAIQPELQWTSEREMVSSTIGVITNVRTDHTDSMGRTLDQIAETLANTTPVDGILVVGDRRFLPVFERRAADLGTRVIVALPDDVAGGTVEGWEEQNRAVALAVTRQLGIPDAVALAGMGNALPDPGTVKAGVLQAGDREVRYIDATAANDPQSLQLLISGLGAGGASAGGAPIGPDLSGWIAVYHHREDRPLRLRDFAVASALIQSSCHLVVTGDRPSAMLWRVVRAQRGSRPTTFLARARLVPGLGDIVRRRAEAFGVIFCGNTKGFDLRFARG